MRLPRASACRNGFKPDIVLSLAFTGGGDASVTLHRRGGRHGVRFA